jgi:N-acetylmuramoyl-L-alanine amidase
MSILKEIVIDAGHYGNYNVGCSGKYYESVGMLKLSRLIRDKLNATGKVHASLTRDNATDISLYQRGKIASDRGAFIFISEHTNATSVPSVKGVEVFYSVDLPNDKVWADKLSSKIAQVMNTSNRGGKTEESKTYKGEDYLTVIDSAQDNGVPHVFLVESGFHSNADDEAKLRDDIYLNKIADVQCEILCEICGFSYNTKPVVVPTPVKTPIYKMVKELEITKDTQCYDGSRYIKTFIKGDFVTAIDEGIITYENRDREIYKTTIGSILKSDCKPRNYIHPYCTGAIIIASSLNIREIPNTNCKILGQFKQNDLITIIDYDSTGKWAKTSLGYISLEYVRIK